MDISTTIMGLFLALICMLPFIIIPIKKSKANKKMQLAFSSIAQKHQMNITQQDFCKHLIIGLDEIKNSVLFYDSNTANEKFIDLNNVKECKAINNSRNVKVNGYNDKTVDKLEIAFKSKSNSATESFELYNSQRDSEINGELQFMDKWSKILGSKLNN